MHNEMYSDQELIVGIQTSDDQAIAYIYRTFLPGIVKYITQNSGKAEDARDIFQEALIVMFRKVKQDQFRLTASFQAYLFSVCRHLWLKHIRDSRLTKKVAVKEYEAIDLDADTEEIIIKSSRLRLYQEYFQKLDSKCQQILQFYFEKISMREIASRLGTTEGYIKKRKFVCKNKLIRMIRQDHQYQELALK